MKGLLMWRGLFPSLPVFLHFFPMVGKQSWQIHQTYLPFVKERRKQKRELREAAAADLEVGSWVMATGTHGNCEVPYVYSKHGEAIFIRLSCRWQGAFSIDGFVGMVVPSCMERKTEHQLQLLTNAHHDMKRCPKLEKHRVPSWGTFQLPLVR